MKARRRIFSPSLLINFRFILTSNSFVDVNKQLSCSSWVVVAVHIRGPYLLCVYLLDRQTQSLDRQTQSHQLLMAHVFIAKNHWMISIEQAIQHASIAANEQNQNVRMLLVRLNVLFSLQPESRPWQSVWTHWEMNTSMPRSWIPTLKKNKHWTRKHRWRYMKVRIH